MRFLDDCLAKEKVISFKYCTFSFNSNFHSFSFSFPNQRIILSEPSRDELGRSLVRLEEDNANSKYQFHEEEAPKMKIADLERHLDQVEKEMSQMNTNQETLNKNCNELKELRFVLMKDSRFVIVLFFIYSIIYFFFVFSIFFFFDF